MIIRAIALAFIVSGLYACSETNPPGGIDTTVAYDLVIRGGRVIDPESGLDAVRDVGITGGTIKAISSNKLSGTRVLDASGRIVAPGFIDLHTHAPYPIGERLQVYDGVTTALDLEAGAFPSTAYGEFLEDGARSHYGASVGHYAIRMKVIEGTDIPYAVTREHGFLDMERPGFRQSLTRDQVEEVRTLLHEGINGGGIGIGFLLDYMSAAVTDGNLDGPTAYETKLGWTVTGATVNCTQVEEPSKIRPAINEEVRALHNMFKPYRN